MFLHSIICFLVVSGTMNGFQLLTQGGPGDPNFPSARQLSTETIFPWPAAPRAAVNTNNHSDVYDNVRGDQKYPVTCANLEKISAQGYQTAQGFTVGF